MLADMETRTRLLALGAIVAQVLFVGDWLVFGALEGFGYSPARHDLSDLGALTARHPVPFLFLLGVSGVLTMAFALGALAPALRVPGRGVAVGAVLVAMSLPALDNLGDVFFRLDCRAADAGCDASAATASWHGKAHIAVFLLALVPTLVAPFALATRMRLLDGWRALAGPARTFGIVAVVALVATGAFQGSSFQGGAQRIAATLVPLGVAALAWAVLSRDRSGANARHDVMTHT
jgi:hypothetical protein